jgi:hypothetical protein
MEIGKEVCESDTLDEQFAESLGIDNENEAISEIIDDSFDKNYNENFSSVHFSSVIDEIANEIQSKLRKDKVPISSIDYKLWENVLEVLIAIDRGNKNFVLIRSRMLQSGLIYLSFDFFSACINHTLELPVDKGQLLARIELPWNQLALDDAEKKSRCSFRSSQATSANQRIIP